MLVAAARASTPGAGPHGSTAAQRIALMIACRREVQR
jgi:hypothetical protein